ncbi:MAG: hypothetical protein IKT57_00255 [Clostridia bacterium]|nr:hypothetical protein [Clostridia bacterium]
MLPTVDFFGTKVTRMIVGDNPFHANSYIPDIHPGAEMFEYYNEENVLKALDHAWECGYNTVLALGSDFMLEVLRKHRAKGGQMNIIFQTYPPADFYENVKKLVEFKPLGIYHQGTTFDELYENENFDEIKKRLSFIHSFGIKAAIGTHVPERALHAEEEDWGADFYVLCLHNTRIRGYGRQSSFITGKPKELIFYAEDRAVMFDAIQKIQKPVIAFKIFSGGQMFRGKTEEEASLQAYHAIEETYRNIKPSDLCAIGVFQRDKDQLKENAEFVKQVLLK